MGLSPPIINDILTLDQNASYNLRSGVTVTRRNVRTNKFGFILDTSSSCIDLIFRPQPNLIIESGVHSLLHSYCHYQIIYAKFHVEIIYPPPYVRKVWH